MLDITRAYNLDFLFPRGDQTIGECLRRHGEFARPEAELLVEYAQGEQGLFVDVGANIGAICLPFARSRPRWRVAAIEANRQLANLLAANALTNHLYNVEPINAAVGPEAKIVNFPVLSLGDRRNYGTLSLKDQQGPAEPVRMMRLDEMTAPSIVKIDVEGFENQVLDGAASLLEKRSTVWLAEAADQFADERRRLIQRFLEFGYTVCWFFVPFATPASPKAPPDRLDLGDVNVVALPPGAPNLWRLPEISDPEAPRPRQFEVYGYLKRYGY